jgi:hypothetical protein
LLLRPKDPKNPDPVPLNDKIDIVNFIKSFFEGFSDGVLGPLCFGS